jgi:acetolactate synthase-1/2/3 large subunit
MKIDGGEMLARMLDREGIKNVFALHGGHIDSIFQACYDHDIRIFDTRHEQAAGHMADAWARLTGQPGVALVTAGPGVTDVVTAVANAYMDAVPMVVVGGRHALAEEELMPLQELHGVPLMQSITKWSRLVRDPKRIPEYASIAFRHATTGRPGPVFLEIPADVLRVQVEEEEVLFPKLYRPEAAPAPPPEAVEKALTMLSQAERPIIMAGRGVWAANACNELREFAELTGIPVCANGITRGAVPEDSPLGLGGFHLVGAAQAMAGAPDAVLLLGARLGLYTGPRGGMIPAGVKIIQVDIEAGEIGRGRDIDVGIVADCREALRALVRAAGGRSFSVRDEWAAKLRQARSAIESMFAAGALEPDRRPIHPYRLAREVSTLMTDAGVLAVDGGETFVWTELARMARRPGRHIGHGYLGCLGTGIPFGLAAKVAYPDERVLVFTGDGSVGLNFSEFDTAVRHNLPVVVVINNDQAWGMCKHEQVVRHGESRIVATELGPTRYEKAAEGFGVYGQFVEEPSEIIPAIERAFASGRPACVNVMTDPDVISPLVQATGPRVERPWAEAVAGRQQAAG